MILAAAHPASNLPSDPAEAEWVARAFVGRLAALVATRRLRGERARSSSSATCWTIDTCSRHVALMSPGAGCRRCVRSGTGGARASWECRPHRARARSARRGRDRADGVRQRADRLLYRLGDAPRPPPGGQAGTVRGDLAAGVPGGSRCSPRLSLPRRHCRTRTWVAPERVLGSRWENWRPATVWAGLASRRTSALVGAFSLCLARVSGLGDPYHRCRRSLA